MKQDWMRLWIDGKKDPYIFVSATWCTFLWMQLIKLIFLSIPTMNSISTCVGPSTKKINWTSW
jgi:hypothetical protein